MAAASSTGDETIVFISASKLAHVFPDIPENVRSECLLLFGSKRSWLYPETPTEHQEARRQPGKYHQMDRAFLDWILEKEKRGEVHFLKRAKLFYHFYPGERDPKAYKRVNAWLTGDNVGAQDPDVNLIRQNASSTLKMTLRSASTAIIASTQKKETADERRKLTFQPLKLDRQFWNDLPREQFKYCASPLSIIRNFEDGFHEYDEICELLYQSDPRLVPLISWPPRC